MKKKNKVRDWLIWFLIYNASSSARRVQTEFDWAEISFCFEILDVLTDCRHSPCFQVTLPCRVENKIGVIQWTRDGFGLGDTRDLSGYSRYKLIGSDDESEWNQLKERDQSCITDCFYKIALNFFWRKKQPKGCFMPGFVREQHFPPTKSVWRWSPWLALLAWLCLVWWEWWWLQSGDF